VNDAWISLSFSYWQEFTERISPFSSDVNSLVHSHFKAILKRAGLRKHQTLSPAPHGATLALTVGVSPKSYQSNLDTRARHSRWMCTRMCCLICRTTQQQMWRPP